MLLRRLELIGFKSFANRVAFEFDAGISVLVGPNGSGKSNVADALRWVLGEQSARALRGKTAEEVIFVGSAGRHPLGMAEVAIVLDNADRRLPLDFAEVRLARRLYRSGDSEYLINGARARRKDLVALLLEVSLHSHGYTIVGQGAVDELVIQRPEERRAVLEHAADISRHQHRLAEARAGLATTAQNLTRGQDLIAELEPHARRLRGQAERAERYAARRAELAAVAQAYFRAALADKGARAAEASAALEGATAACEHFERRIAGGEAERQAARARLAECESRLAELRGRLEQAHREREACLGEHAAIRERVGFLAARRESSHARAARAAERAAALATELAAAPAGPEGTEAVSLERLAGLDERLEQLGSQLRRARLALEATREERGRLAGRRQAFEAEAEAARRAEAARLASAAERAARLTAIEERLADATERLAVSEPALAASRRRDAEARATVAEAEQGRRAARGVLQEAAERQHRACTELQVARAALQAVEREEAEHCQAGCGDGQPARLGALLRVRADAEPAVAAALGPWAEAEVVDERTACSLADSDGDGRGRRLVVSDQAEARWAAARIFAERVAALLAGLEYELAAGLVQRGAGGPGAESSELASCVVVADLETAREAARRLASAPAGAWRVVTRQGVMITHFGGWVLGAPSPAARLLSFRRRRATAVDEVERAEQRAAEAAALHAAHERALVAAEERERAARQREQETTADLRLLTGRAEDARAEIRRLEAARGMLASAGPMTLAPSSPSPGDLLRQTTLQLQRLEDQEAAQRGAIDSLQLSVECARDEREQARLVLEQIRSEAQARLAFVRARTRELEQAQLEQSQAEAEAAHCEQAVAESRAGVAALEARAAETATTLDRLVGEVASASSTRTNLAAEIDRQERGVAGLRGELAAARTAREQALVARQQGADELERLRQEAAAVAEEWGLEGDGVVQLRLPDGDRLSRAAAAEEPPPIDLATARRRMLTLQRELRAQGAVGASVLEEYREVDERLRFLSTQAADLRRATAELEGVIGELEDLMRRGFDEAFGQVNGAFARTFATLFGGGTARLVLTDERDPLRGGVDIVAQPPGKRLQSLMSLSGGERALTSTALIFALLAINPLPFCVLDEVDAALDESNACRFAALLREYAQQTQFIVITHNRATMETARTLYGISMGGDGVTTVVALRPAEALAAARNGQAENRAESAVQV